MYTAYWNLSTYLKCTGIALEFRNELLEEK